ncbi:MAG: acyltransferase [Bacteroidetes bacterium]|nr:acyltransferase [Bacteroidota bacterium]
MMEKRQIDSLTATRGFAALLVVIFHFGLECIPFKYLQQFFARGNLAVSYFYVLSGFIMCWTYETKKISFGAYMKRRFARIAPVYYLALFAAIIYILVADYTGALPLEENFGKKVFLDVFFLQSYVPGYAMAINGPGWSLSVEMFFYLLFPLLILFYRKSPKQFMWFAAILYIVSQAGYLYAEEHRSLVYSDIEHHIINYFPLNHLNAFVLGMVSCYVYNNSKSISQFFSPLLFLIFIVLAIIYTYYPLHNGTLAPLFGLFIIALAKNPPRVLKSKSLIYLGEISYSIYILQWPVHLYVSKLNILYVHIEGALFFYCYTAILIIVSAICYRFIETPSRKWINGWGEKKIIA